MLYFFALSLRSILLLITLRSCSYSGCALPPRVRFAILFSRLTPQSTRLRLKQLKKPGAACGGGLLVPVVGCSFVLSLVVREFLAVPYCFSLLFAACNSMISYGSLLLFAAVSYWAPQFFAAHCGLLLFSQ
jgi:hypothetical protein